VQICARCPGTYTAQYGLPFWRECNRTVQICCSVPRHLYSPARSPFLAGVQPCSADLLPGAPAPTQPSTVSLLAGVQPYNTDLLIGALAHTAQYGLPFCGSTTVHRRSFDRCPGIFSPVRSPFSAGVQPHSADLLFGAPAPAQPSTGRSPFLRECNRTVQIYCSVLLHLQPSTVSLFDGSVTVQFRSTARCSGTYSTVRSPFLWEYNRTTQIC
jgi:hypothetical protein